MNNPTSLSSASSRSPIGAPLPTSSSSPSPFCCQHTKENARNLVVCIDGTSNQFGKNNTNVVKLFADINRDALHPKQYAYYSSGIGTSPKSLFNVSRMKKILSDKAGMAIAWNVEEIVKNAYEWLAQRYEDGDRIFLFGFSRGAYQVRVLAAMIHSVGLIKEVTEKQIATAYDHYRDIRSGRGRILGIAEEFKKVFSWEGLKVHFVGVWDTVSSVGFVKQDVFLSVSSSAAHACHFRHALALDERRVKFMPEYFHEMNSFTNDRISKYIVSSDIDHIASFTDGRRQFTTNDNQTDSSVGKKNGNTDIKEVWFAGCHSDVGGTNRPGKSHQAGNVSLLWMRREATASGLKLQPTDIVWVPDDLKFGTSNSMRGAWRVVEFMPIKHQVSFSGSGEDARRLHWLQPRRIIPGQKVHASILYADSYEPQATLGEGFVIPIIRAEGTQLNDQIWETGLPFDDTAAQELVRCLGGQQGAALIYLDRLLFMLRFEEGKKCVRNVPNWQEQFMRLMHNRKCAPLVRLVTIVAYYEASSNLNALNNIELSEDILHDAKKSLCTILAAHKHGDGPRVVALLRPLMRHPTLRMRLLTADVLDTLVTLLDVIVSHSGGNFGQAIDGLICLLQCEDTRVIIINWLGTNYPNSKASRLSRILEMNNSHLLTAALRMVMTMARIPVQEVSEARHVCSAVKPRLRQLAKRKDGLVGLLAVEILFVLYDPNEQQQQLNVRNGNVRANLASALVRLQPERRTPGDETGSRDPGQQILRRLFGLDVSSLSIQHRRLIDELTRAVWNGNARDRTASMMTLLKLCETEIIRNYLREIRLLEMLINQLQRKERALLAAYALAICMKYADMMQSIKDNENLPKYIVGMLRLDYFDDAVGPVEGFQIFGDFMQHASLRKMINDYDITEVLNTKLGKGKPKEIRTSLICLDIFRSFDDDEPWARELVEKSLEHLRKPVWKAQKAGVAILSALVQTDFGVAAIGPRIAEVVEMLLPEGYLPIQSLAPSWMFGPACALRILVQNPELRHITRETIQYGSLKHLYLSGTLVDETDTSAWRIRTPNRGDVVDMLDKMIKVVDDELSKEDLMLVGDIGLPHIRHWNRLVTLVGDRIVIIASFLPALLGVSTFAILAGVVLAPAYASVRVYDFFRHILMHNEDMRILDSLHRDRRYGRNGSESARDMHMSETPPGDHVAAGVQIGAGLDGENTSSSGHENENPLSIEVY